MSVQALPPLFNSLEQQAQQLRSNPAALKAMQDMLRTRTQQGQAPSVVDQPHTRLLHDREVSFSDWA